MKELVFLAGPNGCGKSTLARAINLNSSPTHLDPDAIARKISDDDSPSTLQKAGREVITLTRSYLQSGTSFSVETTLSGKRNLVLMLEAKQLGYEIVLHFIAVQEVEISLKRIASRVLLGGHNVPKDDVLRRYNRSLENLKKAVELTNSTYVYDNSQRNMELLITVVNKVPTIHTSSLPKWVIKTLGITI